MSDSAVPLHTSWIARNAAFGDISEWIVCGDHIVGAAEHTIFCLDIYTGAAISDPLGFPFRLTSRRGDPNLTYADGIVYLADGSQLVARDVRAGGRPLPGWAPAAVGGAIGSLEAVNGMLVVTYSGPDGGPMMAGLSGQTGAAVWGPAAITAVNPGQPGLGDRAAYFVADNKLCAVNVGSGNVRYVAAPKTSTPLLDQSRPPLVSGTSVFCGGDSVYAFDYRTGAQQWNKLAGGNGNWNIALSSDRSTVVATGGGGSVCGLRAADGEVLWQHPVEAPEVPLVVGRTVYTLAAQNTELRAFDTASGAVRGVYSLGDAVAAATPLIGNGCLFVPTADGELRAMPFGSQNAAYFDGAASYIAVTPPAAEFDFGLADFTIELWVRSTNGGDLVSASPATSGRCGWRLKLASSGAVQFAIVDATFTNADLWTTAPLGTADGNWHHVAMVRSRGEVALYVDGITRKASRAYQRGGKRVNPHYVGVSAPPLAIDGGNTLTIGTWCERPGAAPQKLLKGLMREVRVWGRALDADAIDSRMLKSLNFLTADLIANWHLAHEWGAPGHPRTQPVMNDITDRPLDATFFNAASLATDLATDDSDYPFLLEKTLLPWPYDSTQHWASCGHDPISIPPVLGATGVLCFGDDIALYGVDKLRGTRQWTVDTPEGVSTPAATPVDGSFLALTREFGLIAIDGRTGETQGVTGFEHMATGEAGGTPLATPAVSSDFIAAADVDGTLWIRARAGGAARSVATAPAPDAVRIVNGTIAVTTPGQLFLVDAATANAKAPIAVDSTVVHFDDARLICVSGGALVCFDYARNISTPAFTSPRLTGTVTGLAAVENGNLLVATTDAGRVYGLSLATLYVKWDYALPASVTPRTLYAPAAADGVVVATCASGRVTMLDGTTGETIGRFDEPHPIATAPIFNHGTLYYGCGEGLHGQLDGALHSVVVGNTMALRLGLQEAPAVRGYAAVATETPLKLMTADAMTLETWVNTQRGGDIFTVLPSDGAQSFAARWWLDPNGAIGIDFSARHAGQAWAAVRVTTGPSAACEGRWHHLAVIAASLHDVRIYLDGTLLPSTSAPLPAPAATGPGCRAFIGAGGPDAAGTPTRYFTGIISELRLWDTWLVLAEISERMHTKLRGDEPNLAAYWNFDAKTVHDASRHGFDGTLVSEDADADFWLTDLPYTLPTYPFLQTAPLIVAESATERTYKLTVKSFKADQTPLSAALSFWYVRYDDSKEPAAITISSADGSHRATLTGVAPDHEMDPGTSFDVPGGAAGMVTLFVTTPEVTHGPSLDIRADFMYPNERYHANVLIDNQKLSRPAPPKLEFQSKLLQDFHYVHGDGIGSKNHRNTFRTVILAREADGSPRVGETVQVWAEEPVLIEEGESAYHVNPNNSQTFTTDHAGEVTLVIEADDLRCPELIVWAGFMARNDRMRVAVDNDVRTGLAAVDGDKMTAEQPRQWRPASEGGPVTDSLLHDNYRDHSTEIAQTMSHLATAAQPAGANTAPKLLSRPPLLRARPPFPDMNQPAQTPMADRVEGLRGVRHINRRQPLTPEYMLASLKAAAAPGEPAPIGFRFACVNGDPDTFTFEFVTHASLPAVLKAPMTAVHPHDLHLTGFFDDIWDGVKDAATSVYDAAQELVVTVGNTVAAAVKVAGEWLQTAIHDIKDAFIAIGKFLEQLALDVLKVIEFLLSFFDFAEIIAVARILKGYVIDALEQTRVSVKALDPSSSVTELLDWFGTLAPGFAAPKIAIASADQSRQQFPAGGAASVNGVDGKFAMAKVNQYGPQSSLALTLNPAAAQVDGITAIVEGVGKALVDFVNAVPSLGSMNFNDFSRLFGTLLEDIVNPVLHSLAEMIHAVFAGIDGMFATIIEMLGEEIYIPFISDLLDWLGLKLTYGDLAGFVIAVPFNVAFRAIHGRKFSDVAPATLPARRVHAPMLGAPAPLSAEDGTMKVVCGLSGICYGISLAVADGIRMGRMNKISPQGLGNAQNPSPPKGPEYIANVLTAATGITYAWATPDVDERVRIAQTAVHSGRIAFYAFRYKYPSKGTMEFWKGDYCVPFASLGAGIASIVMAYQGGKLATAADEAELWTWNIPQLYRPLSAFPLPKPVIVLVAAGDVGLCGASGIIHLAK